MTGASILEFPPFTANTKQREWNRAGPWLYRGKAHGQGCISSYKAAHPSERVLPPRDQVFKSLSLQGRFSFQLHMTLLKTQGTGSPESWLLKMCSLKQRKNCLLSLLKITTDKRNNKYVCMCVCKCYDIITISQKLFSHTVLFSQSYLCPVGTYIFLWKRRNQHLISIMSA